MHLFSTAHKCLLLCILLVPGLAVSMMNTTASVPADAQSALAHDGSHDFDFELGTWKIHLKKLDHPLTGSTTWIEFDGSSVTRKVWNGRSQLEEFETDGPSGHIEGMTLRLYNPQSHQWSLYWVNSRDGKLAQPTIGEFKNGRGEFIDQEPFKGRAILVRYVWSEITPTSAHFEQSFSDDGGKTWEVNWITDQTRVGDEPDVNTGAQKTGPKDVSAEEAAHSFDFEFGTWHAHLKRLVHPLSGSTTWVDYDGSSVVRKIWGGRANLGELEVDGDGVHIEGLTLRLYNPESHQWSLFWANSKDGSLAVPTVGEFQNGRGEFLDQEEYEGKTILVRFVFSDITSSSFKTEQSFSADGGKTWEPNWIATFTCQGQSN